MMKTNDYKNFDKITIFVKSKKVEKIIEYYKIFGWEVESQTQNKHYADLTDLVFCRPHKFENKDELQLLQIYLEDKLNTEGKNEKDRHTKSKCLIITFGVLGFLFLLLGTLICFDIFSLGLGFGISFCTLAFVLLVVGIIFLPKLFKKEKIILAQKQTKVNQEIQEICDRAKKLTGGEK